jgi:OpgC protein
MGWGWLLDAPWFALLGAGTLLYQPEFMGILPVFLWSMLILPLVVLGFERFGSRALWPSFLLYGAVQLWGWNLPGLGGTEIELNPLAWQVLFVLGAWFGRRSLLSGRAIGIHPPLIAAAASVILVGLWMRAVDHGIINGPSFDFGRIMLKQDLAWPRLVHALAVSYMAVTFFRRKDILLRHLPLRALAAVGRNSLQVFCVGLFLSFLAATTFRLYPAERLWLEIPLIGGGCAALMAFAMQSEHRTRSANRLQLRSFNPREQFRFFAAVKRTGLRSAVSIATKLARLIYGSGRAELVPRHGTKGQIRAAMLPKRDPRAICVGQEHAGEVPYPIKSIVKQPPADRTEQHGTTDSLSPHGWPGSAQPLACAERRWR